MDLGFWVNLMCPNQEWFRNFRDINGGKFFLEETTSCLVTSISDMQLKMFNSVTRLLRNARYFLEFRRNLISLGQLDTMTYTYKVENGKIKIMKSSLVVINVEIKDGL